MRVVLAVNNRLGLWATEFVRSAGAEVVCLILHPAQRRRHGEEILKAAGVSEDCVFDGSDLSGAVLERIKALSPDMCLSVLFGYIVRPPFIGLFPKGVVNLHPAMLPYNRGAHPNVWSIVDRTPSGTTLHYIDPGVDTGDIIAQKAVECEPWDTGKTLYEKTEVASLALLVQSWPTLSGGTPPRTPQPKSGPGVTSHRIKDVDSIDGLDLDAPTTARRLIDILRARTFPPFKGAFFEASGKKIYLRLEMEPGE